MCLQKDFCHSIHGINPHGWYGIVGWFSRGRKGFENDESSGVVFQAQVFVEQPPNVYMYIHEKNLTCIIFMISKNSGQAS